MPNGNTEVIREMREIIKNGEPLDVNTRDRLLFTAVIDIYERLELFEPVFTFYRVGMFFASAIGLAVIGFIGAMLTGKVDVTFK